MPFMAGLLYKLYGRGDLVMAFVIAATFNSLATLGGVATSALAAKGYGYIAAIISGASALAQTVQLFSISFMSSDLTTISLFQTSIPIFATSLLFYFAKRKCGLSIRTKYFDYLRYKDFFVKGRFLQVSHISEVAAANFPQIAIHAILGPAYVTLYAVAVKIPSLITNTFIMKMVSASFPFFRQLWSLKKFRQYWSYHTFVQYYSAVLGTYLLIAFYLYFPDILRIWGFHDYADLQWLGLGVGLLSLRESLVRSTGIFVISTGDYKYASKMSLIDTVTMVSVSTSLMGTFGVQAIFFGNLISGIMLITMIALFKISFSPRATSHRIYYIRCCYFLLLFVTLQFIGKLSPTWYIGTSILICLMMAELLLVAKTGLGSRHLLSLLRC
jgi:O-antigen/teichoic acid export membrane protein